MLLYFCWVPSIWRNNTKSWWQLGKTVHSFGLEISIPQELTCVYQVPIIQQTCDHGSWICHTDTHTHTPTIAQKYASNLYDIFYCVWHFEALMSVQSCWRNCPWASRTYRWLYQSLGDDLSGETSAARPTPTSEMAWQFVSLNVWWSEILKKMTHTFFWIIHMNKF